MRFISLPGVQPYQKIREWQLELVELRAADQIPDTWLFLEHEPVITRGQGLQLTGEERPRHLPLSVELPPGVAYAEVERGGDLTCHEPGQLVIYPICKLDGKGFAPARDVGGFIRRFEGSLISELASWEGGHAEYRPKATGVWFEGRKVASLGIAVRHWVTYHGMAINCVNTMENFSLISPCGFAPQMMARLQDFTFKNCPVDWSQLDWRTRLEERLARRIAQASGFNPELAVISREWAE